jgi:hypothetical protein
MLTLCEQLLILVIDDENGAVLRSAEESLEAAMSGAVIAELALRGKVHIEHNHRLELQDSEATGEAFLDDALVMIKDSDQARKVTYWLKRVVDKPKLFRDRLLEELAEKGVLKMEDTNLTWIIPSPLFPEHNAASVKYLIKHHLREMVLTGQPLELRDLALLDLAKASQLLYLIFTKDERKSARQLIYERIVELAMKDHAANTIQEVSAAVESTVAAD